MPGIGLVSNPYSKKNRKHPDRLQKLIECAPDKDLVRLPDSFEKMDASMEHFKNSKVDVIAINGGDGTVHVALTSMMKIYKGVELPKIAILKGGTMNQTATNLKLKGNTIDIFKRVVRAWKESGKLRTKQISLLKVNERYGFIFGSGAVCTFMDLYHRSSNPSPLVAAKSVLAMAGSMLVHGKLAAEFFKPTWQELNADGFSFGRAPYLAFLITTLPSVGLGMELTFRAKADPKKAQMVAFRDKAKVVPQVARVWLGRSVPPDVVDDTVGSRFFINGEKSFRYTLDGDMYSSSGKLVVETGPLLDLVTE